MRLQQTLGRLSTRVRAFDWQLVRGSALLSAGSVVARGLAMIFWLALARAFRPSDYGAIQYMITLGLLVAAGTQPLGQHMLARALAAHRDQPHERATQFANIIALLLGAALVTAAGAVPALLLLGRFDMGVVVVFLGVTLFYTYWGISTGVGDTVGLTLAYVGSNLVQLLLTIGAVLLGVTSPSLIVAIYGISYVLPLALLRWRRPFSVPFDTGLVRRETVAAILTSSWPIWISHLSYTLYIAAPVLLLEHFFGAASVGVYSLGATLIAVFTIINSSLSTLLMPRLAQLAGAERRRLFRSALALLLVANAAMLAVFAAVVQWGIGQVFGAAYVGATSVYVLLALGAVLVGVHGLVAAMLVGSGRLRLEMAGRLTGLAVALVVGLLAVPRFADVGAAAMGVAGMLGSLSVYIVARLRGSQQRAGA